MFTTSSILPESMFSSTSIVDRRKLTHSNHTDMMKSLFFLNKEEEEEEEDDDSSNTKPVKRQKKSSAAQDDSTAAGGGGGCHRRLWVKNRSTAWWDRCNHSEFPESEFKKCFRMTKGTFHMLCNELESVITKKDTMLRAAIPVKQRVAVCVWRLATGEPLRLVSKRFGLGISTCHKLVLEVCSAIRTVLMPRFLGWPDSSRMASIKSEFQSISGIPGVGGSLYTTHIPIIAPKASVTAYFNRRHTERTQKTSYSMTLQGVLDPSGLFTDVCIGWPGSMADDQILEKSALFHRAERGHIQNSFLVGSSSYPLTDWLMVPYTHQNMTWTQHGFNERIGLIEAVAKNAFSRLKGRWMCLQKRAEVKLQDLPVVLGACCVLHNVCELGEEGVEEELRFQIFDDGSSPVNPVRSAAAARVRDSIAHNLLHHGVVENGGRIGFC